MQVILTPEIVLAAYHEGLFPMAENADCKFVHWVCPEMRGQLSIDDLHIPRSLKRAVKSKKLGKNPYEITINQDFPRVIRECAVPTPDREETWINQNIIDTYEDLHEQGFVHSVECWCDGDLVGGLYGVSIGAVFLGESMFSRRSDASKVALVHLVARLHYAEFKVLDTQFINPHLEQFGIYEIPHKEYMRLFHEHETSPCVFDHNEVCEDDLIRRYLQYRVSA